MRARSLVSLLSTLCILTAPIVTSAQVTLNLDTTTTQLEIQRLEAQLASLKAQLAQLLAGGATLSTTASTTGANTLCVVLNRTLSVGAKGTDVSDLQRALASNASIYPLGSITGFFGPATRAAVARLQERYDILVDGIATAIVGPRTRAFLSMQCATSTSATSTTMTMPPITLSLANLFGTTTSRIFTGTASTSTGDQKLASVFRWVVATPATTSASSLAPAPTVRNFTGPTTLTVNQMGTWNIDATDPSGNPLSYGANWGDATSSPASLLAILAGGNNASFSSLSVFQHSYTAPGVYTVSKTVKTAAGTSVTATTIVIVTENAGSSLSDFLNSMTSTNSTITNLLNSITNTCTTCNSTSTAEQNSSLWLTQGAFCSAYPSLCSLSSTSTIDTTIPGNPYTSGTLPMGNNSVGLPEYFNTIGKACAPVGSFVAVYTNPGFRAAGLATSSQILTGGVTQLQCGKNGWFDPLSGATR